MSSLLSAAAYLTDFADQAVLLPAAALLAAALFLAGWRRGALAWSIAVAGTLVLVLVLKLGFGACGRLITGGEVESPSGHTAAAGVFYGSILAYIAQRTVGRSSLTVLILLGIVILVGASRVLLGAHTIAEVCVGAVVGVLAALIAVRLAGPPPEKQARTVMALLPVAVLIFLLHGLRLPAEAAIHQFSVSVWPFTACR